MEFTINFQSDLKRPTNEDIDQKTRWKKYNNIENIIKDSKI